MALSNTGLAPIGSPVVGPSKAGEEFRIFCVAYGYLEYMDTANLQLALDVYIMAAISGPREYWGYLPARNVEQRDFATIEHQASKERDRRVAEARTLFLQLFHVYKGYDAMSASTTDEARRYFEERIPEVRRRINMLATTRR